MIPAWLIGAAVGMGVLHVLIGLGVLAIGVLGLLLTPLLAIWAGAAAAAIADSRAQGRTTAIVVLCVALLMAGYLWRGQVELASSGLPQGGPNLPPDGAAVIDSPRR